MAGTETEADIRPEDIIPLPPSEEGFDGEAVPVLLDLVTDKLREYVSEAANNDEPISFLGFAMEMIYGAGVDEGKSRRR